MQAQVLRNLLSHINGATFIGLDIITTPTLNKTMPGDRKTPNPHFGRITKVVKGMSGQAFTNKTRSAYESMVKRRLAAEGKDPEQFVLSARVWGVRVANTPFVEHNDELYLEVIVQNEGTPVYCLDGNPIDISDIIGMREHKPAEQGGLENKVTIRAIRSDSIHALRIDGVEVTTRS